MKSQKPLSIDVTKIGLLIMPVFITILFVSQFYIHSGLPYEIDQVNVHLGNALKTNDPDSKLYYLESSLTKLEPYNDNSGFLFVTENTDMNVTKDLLKSAIKKTKAELNTTKKDQWMVLPHNDFDVFLEENIKDLQNRLLVYKKAYGINPYHNPILYVVVFSVITLITSLALIEIFINSKRTIGYWIDDYSKEDVDFWHRY